MTGEEALILPTMGRTEIDLQESGPQFVSVEDTVCAVHASHGAVAAGRARPALRGGHRLPAGAGDAGRHGPTPTGPGSRTNYDLDPRAHLAAWCPAARTTTSKIRRKGGFVLPNGPRDSRTFDTATGKAMLTVNQLEHVERPAGHG